MLLKYSGKPQTLDYTFFNRLMLISKIGGNADHDGLWVKHGQTKNTLFGETLHNLSQGMGWQCKRPPPRLMHPIASRFNKDIFDKFQLFSRETLIPGICCYMKLYDKQLISTGCLNRH